MEKQTTIDEPLNGDTGGNTGGAEMNRMTGFALNKRRDFERPLSTEEVDANWDAIEDEFANQSGGGDETAQLKALLAKTTINLRWGNPGLDDVEAEWVRSIGGLTTQTNIRLLHVLVSNYAELAGNSPKLVVERYRPQGKKRTAANLKFRKAGFRRDVYNTDSNIPSTYRPNDIPLTAAETIVDLLPENYFKDVNGKFPEPKGVRFGTLKKGWIYLRLKISLEASDSTVIESEPLLDFQMYAQDGDGSVHPRIPGVISYSLKT